MHAFNVALLVLIASAAAPVLTAPVHLTARTVDDVVSLNSRQSSPNDMFVDENTVTPEIITGPGSVGVATTNTRELDDKRETKSRDLSDDIWRARRRNIVNDHIARVIKSRDVDRKQTIQARGLKRYDDLAAALILRRVNLEKLARRDALDDYISQVINSRDVDPKQTIQARGWKWYDDLAAALILRRDLNRENLARRDALIP